MACSDSAISVEHCVGCSSEEHRPSRVACGCCSLDTGPVRWRGEGGDQETTRELAYRLALCWNLAEGWPTEALEKGILRSVEDTLVQLLALLELRSEEVPEEVRSLANSLSCLLEKRDGDFDLTDGRPHDCPGCVGKPAPSGG